MATLTGRHRAAPARDVGDAWEELKADLAVVLCVVLFALMDLAIVLPLWQVSPPLAVTVGVLIAAALAGLVHRMRRSTS